MGINIDIFKVIDQSDRLTLDLHNHYNLLYLKWEVLTRKIVELWENGNKEIAGRYVYLYKIHDDDSFRISSCFMYSAFQFHCCKR